MFIIVIGRHLSMFPRLLVYDYQVFKPRDIFTTDKFMICNVIVRMLDVFLSD